jgi:hypothetical protein
MLICLRLPPCSNIAIPTLLLLLVFIFAAMAPEECRLAITRFAATLCQTPAFTECRPRRAYHARMKHRVSSRMTAFIRGTLRMVGEARADCHCDLRPVRPAVIVAAVVCGRTTAVPFSARRRPQIALVCMTRDSRTIESFQRQSREAFVAD